MSRRGDREFLLDMLEACRRIEAFVEGISYGEFLDDIKTQDAILRNIEILGEASKKISNVLKGKYAEVEWKKIASTRDKLIHFYFGVNLEIVWDIVKKEIPKLKEKISKILEKEYHYTL